MSVTAVEFPSFYASHYFMLLLKINKIEKTTVGNVMRSHENLASHLASKGEWTREACARATRFYF